MPIKAESWQEFLKNPLIIVSGISAASTIIFGYKLYKSNKSIEKPKKPIVQAVPAFTVKPLETFTLAVPQLDPILPPKVALENAQTKRYDEAFDNILKATTDHNNASTAYRPDISPSDIETAKEAFKYCRHDSSKFEKLVIEFNDVCAVSGANRVGIPIADVSYTGNSKDDPKAKNAKEIEDNLRDEIYTALGTKTPLFIGIDAPFFKNKKLAHLQFARPDLAKDAKRASENAQTINRKIAEANQQFKTQYIELSDQYAALQSQHQSLSEYADSCNAMQLKIISPEQAKHNYRMKVLTGLSAITGLATLSAYGLSKK